MKKPKHMLTGVAIGDFKFTPETFFDDIREDFVKWCAENNVYCDPQ